jgi:hypothetical protein
LSTDSSRSSKSQTRSCVSACSKLTSDECKPTTP